MKDGDLRGIVLQEFYDLRNQPDWLNMLALPEFIAVEPDIRRLVNVCEQIGDSNTQSLLRCGSTSQLLPSINLTLLTPRKWRPSPYWRG
jgi:hypothetical protein